MKKKTIKTRCISRNHLPSDPLSTFSCEVQISCSLRVVGLYERSDIPFGCPISTQTGEQQFIFAATSFRVTGTLPRSNSCKIMEDNFYSITR